VFTRKSISKRDILNVNSSFEEYFVAFEHVFILGTKRMFIQGSLAREFGFVYRFIKCSSNCARCDWSVRVHYSSIKHSAYVTRVHYNSTYARKLRHENFALDKI